MWVWILGLLLVIATAAWVAMQERSQRSQAVLLAGLMQEVASTADWLDSLSPEQRQQWRREQSRRQFRWRFSPPEDWQDGQALSAHHPVLMFLKQEIAHRQPQLVRVHDDDDRHERRFDHGELWLQLQLIDGGLVYARLPERLGQISPARAHAQAVSPLAMWGAVVAVVVLGLTGLTWVGVVYATRPLKHMTQAALAVAQNPSCAPLPEDGPTEVQQAAKAFNHMQTQIQAHMAERTHLLAAIAHDLQTPMTRLRLKTEWVGDDDLRNRMQSDLLHMQQLVQEGLTLSRSWSAQPELQKVDLVQLMETLQQDWQDSAWAVSCTLPASLCVVETDVQSLQRVLSNVVHNAVLYGQQAHVTLYDEVDAWRVTVDDQGLGVPPEALEKVLQPFVRLETSRSRETGGTGLGLAIAYNLMQSLGGYIRLSNRPEGGLRVDLGAAKAAHNRRPI